MCTRYFYRSNYFKTMNIIRDNIMIFELKIRVLVQNI